MRICLLSREFPPDTGWGGIATFMHDLAMGLVDLSHEVEIICLSADNRQRTYRENGLTVHRVPWQDRYQHQQSLLTAMPYSHSILKQITALWQRFVELHAIRAFEVVEAPELFAEGLFCALTKCAPLVVRLHTPHFKFIHDEFHNIGQSFDHHFIALLERLTLMNADAISSPSSDLAKFVSADVGVEESSIRIIRTPIDVNKFCPNGPTALPATEKLTVLFAGRLEERKGVRVLIDALPAVVRQHPQVQFVIIGHDTQTGPGGTSVLAELRRSLKQNGCEQFVKFITGVPNSEMPMYYRSADVCVVPSLYDNAPLTCLEALTTGKPVIATLAGGMKEYIADGVSGTIIPAGDCGALTRALLDLLSNGDKRNSFGAEARRRAIAQNDRTQVAQQTVTMYEQAARVHRTGLRPALFRHPAEQLAPATNAVMSSFDASMYDLLCQQSLRFRLMHAWCMLRDRPRLTLARLVSRIAGGLLHTVGCKSRPNILMQLERSICAKTSCAEDRELAMKK